MLLSQSSSRSLQISVEGVPGVAVHSVVEPSSVQINIPSLLHSPIPTEQLSPSLNPSSTSPSQSLST